MPVDGSVYVLSACTITGQAANNRIKNNIPGILNVILHLLGDKIGRPFLRIYNVGFSHRFPHVGASEAEWLFNKDSQQF
jgi:hypothetical protein